MSFRIDDHKGNVKPCCKCAHYERFPGGLYQSLRAGLRFNHDDTSKRWGVLSASLSKAARRPEGDAERRRAARRSCAAVFARGRCESP